MTTWPPSIRAAAPMQPGMGLSLPTACIVAQPKAISPVAYQPKMLRFTAAKHAKRTIKGSLTSCNKMVCNRGLMTRLLPAAVLAAALAAVWALPALAQSAPQGESSGTANATKQPPPARSAAAGGSAVVRDEAMSNRVFRELDRN